MGRQAADGAEHIDGQRGLGPHAEQCRRQQHDSESEAHWSKCSVSERDWTYERSHTLTAYRLRDAYALTAARGGE